MTDTTGERQAAIETMIAWQQARDASEPGSKEYQLLDEEYRKAKAILSNIGKEK